MKLFTINNNHGPDVDVWWRAEDRRYANYTPFSEFEDEACGSHLRIEVNAYKVVKYTPKGVKLSINGPTSTQILGKSIKQFAVPTVEFALQDLVRRKQKHVRMAQARADTAREHLAASLKCWESVK